jgi:hypothetical protein
VDGTTLTVEEAAEAVLVSRKVLSAATRRSDAAQRALRERQPEAPADRTEADRAKQDRKLAEAAHHLALDGLRAALMAERSTPVLDAERLKAAVVEDGSAHPQI